MAAGPDGDDDSICVQVSLGEGKGSTHHKDGTSITLGQAPIPPKDTLGQMGKILGVKDIKWRSTGQEWLVGAVIQGKTDVVGVLKTGGGKSMAVLMAAVMTGKPALLIVPLKSLFDDWGRKLNEMGVKYVSMKDMVYRTVGADTRVLLATVEMTKKSSYQESVKAIAGCQGFCATFVDECHYGGEANGGFRDVLVNPYAFRMVEAPMVLLSATVPPSGEGRLAADYGLATDYITVRETTDRPELTYVLKTCSSGEEEVFWRVVAFVGEKLPLLKTEERMLIFVRNKVTGEKLSARLQSGFYHGGGDLVDKDRKKVLTDWQKGVCKVLVSTNALSAGNDNRSIRYLIHAGTPMEFLAFIQELGRAGRDGVPSFCVTFPSANYRVNNLDRDPNGRRAMHDYCFGRGKCLRFSICDWNDGAGKTCSVRVAVAP